MKKFSRQISVAISVALLLASPMTGAIALASATPASSSAIEAPLPNLPDSLADLVDPADTRISSEEGIVIEGEPSSQTSPAKPTGYSPQGTVGSGVTVCVSNTQHPHWSDGAQGAVAKIEVSCTNSGSGPASVIVNVKGQVGFTATLNGTIQTRATSDYPQSIKTDGKKIIFYIPQPGKNAGVGNGYWVTTHTFQIVSPVRGTIGSETVVIKKDIKRSGVV